MTIVHRNRYGRPTWNPWGWNAQAAECECADFVPRADVVEDENSYHLYVELPGMGREDVSVNVEDGVLTVSGERKAPEVGSDHFRRFERRFGKFERSFRLGDTVDVAGISASMEKGVLSITLPKREESKPRTIEVAVN